MGKYQLIAATGCPTGIAHTYMVQEALEQAARKKGITIKVETHGQIGIENELTAEEIKQADAVIIAADKDVHSERFAGKRVIDVSVSTGIKDAQRLIDEALAGKGTILADKEATSEDIIQFKQMVSQYLTPYASAILLDPEYGLPAAALREKECGLLLAYEKKAMIRKCREDYLIY